MHQMSRCLNDNWKYLRKTQILRANSEPSIKRTRPAERGLNDRRKTLAATWRHSSSPSPAGRSDGRMENDFYNKTTALSTVQPLPSPLRQQSIYPFLPSFLPPLSILQSMTATITPLARQNVSYFVGRTVGRAEDHLQKQPPAYPVTGDAWFCLSWQPLMSKTQRVGMRAQ